MPKKYAPLEPSIEEISKIIYKYDPMSLNGFFDENKMPLDEYDSQAKSFICDLDFCANGPHLKKRLTKKLVHNLIYSTFCSYVCSGIDGNGKFWLSSKKQIQKSIGKKSDQKYKDMAKELYDYIISFVSK